MSAAALLILGLVVVAGMFLIVDGVARAVLERGDTRARQPIEGARASRLVARSEPRVLLEAPAATKGGRYLEQLLQRADLSLTGEVFIGAVVVTMLLEVVLLFAIAPGLPVWGKLIIALAGGLVTPFAYLRYRGRRRTDKFLEMFPDALDLIVRSLRIGHPLSVAISTVGSEMPDPVGKEFRITARQIAYGMSPPQAIDALANRVDANDVKFFAVTVQIQYESGGNLSEILESLSGIIRSRFHLFRRVRTLTAEGRFSAWFLSILPIAMAFIVSIINPAYYASVRDFKYYTPLVVTTLLMLVLNAVVARWITRLKV